MRINHALPSFAFAVCLIASSLHGADHAVTVSAGDSDRRDTVVELTLPEDVGTGPFVLADEQAGAVPFQRIGDAKDRRAAFILKDLKAGQTRTYALKQQPGVDPPKGELVEAKAKGGKVALSVRGKPVLVYLGEKTPVPQGYDPAFARGGYIHPVYAPSGKPITDDYPPNHKHHHGVWAPWTKTEFEGRHPDFWNMGDKTGTVETADFGQTWGGAVAGGFTARHRFVDLSAKPEPKVALNEEWRVTAYNVGAADKPYHVFDWTSTQTCATDSPLILPEYRYGGLGFRGHRQWDGAANCFFLTSEAKTRADGHATRARWCHVGGKIDGELAGVAILDHPSNFRHPQPMRIHPDEPFFNYAPMQAGEMRIEPGKPYVMRYRFVVSDGPPDVKEIERLWNDFAKPVEVTVK